MKLNNNVLSELELLSHFNLESMQEGLKVHSSADPALVDAAKRLFDKGVITQADGGYLTDRGIEAARHVTCLLSLLAEELPSHSH
jgi:uncharacterized protein (TIGR02647 family)